MARKQRLVVGGAGLRPVTRQPAVRVRDAFIPGAAARGASSDLEQVARGLGQLAPNLTQFAVSLQEKRRQEGIRAGRARFEELAQEQEDFGEAMRKGLVEARDNPFFRAGLLESAGRIAADRYGDDLRVGHAQLQDKTDFGAFDKMASELFTQHQGALGDVSGNEVFAAAFNNRTQAHRASERSNFAKGVSGALIEQASDQLYAEIANVIDIGLDNGLTTAAMGAEITRLTDQYYTQGVNGTLINQITANALKAAAIELATLDPNNALALLDGLGESIMSGPQVDGKRQSLTLTRQGDRVINEAREAAAGIIQRNHRFDDYLQTQEVQAQTEAVFSDALTALNEAEDPTRVDLGTYIAQLAEINPTAAATLTQMQASVGSASFKTHEGVFVNAATRLWEGDPLITPEYVSGLVAARQLSVEDGWRLVQEYQQMQASGNTAQRDPYFANELSDMNRTFQDSVGVLSGARGAQANKAEASFYRDYVMNQETYQQLSDDDKIVWLRSRAEYWSQYYGGSTTIAGELRGRAVQAFPGADVPWDKFVVVSPLDLDRMTAEAGSGGLISDASLAILQRYGVTPDNIAQFISTQRTLIEQEVFAPSGGEGAPTTTEAQ